jgi:hypothetical protein
VGSRRTQSLQSVQRARGAKTQSKIFEQDQPKETLANPIFPIETMNLTLELPMANIFGE